MKFIVARQRESLVDLFEVTPDGVRTNLQLRGDFALGQAIGVETQHIELACG